MTQPRLGNPAPVSLVPNKFVKIWYRNMVPLWCSLNIHSDEKNELLSRRLKLWIPRMSTHTNIVTKYQSDRSYDLGDIRLGVPHVFFGPGGLCLMRSPYRYPSCRVKLSINSCQWRVISDTFLPPCRWEKVAVVYPPLADKLV
eukprot:sb/3474059/